MVALFDNLAGNLFDVKVAFDAFCGDTETEASLAAFRNIGAESVRAFPAGIAIISDNVGL